MINKLYIYTLVLFLSSCATYKTSYKKQRLNANAIPTDKELIYTMYLVGDAGKLDENGQNLVIQAIGKKLKTETKQSALLYLGDNIYPNGLPKKGNKKRRESEQIIDTQLEIVQDYKGKTIFIPGNHDWRGDVKGIERQEKYIEKRLANKHVFFPEDGCALQKIKINDDIVIIAIDSQWYLEDWDTEPRINDQCEIKTRAKFFDELESLIKKSEGKTTIIAMHHPLYSNGSHGGLYSLKQQFKPLPLIGSLISLLRKTGGISTQDLQSKRYVTFRNRIVTLAQHNSKVIFVSGHEHNLQFIKKNNIQQIISGSGAKITASKNSDGNFAYSNFGYAKLNIFKDGSTAVQFYSIENKKDTMVYQTTVFSATKKNDTTTVYKKFPKFVKSAIYAENETTKSKFYQKLWGKRYRQYYSKKIKAPTVDLDTLFGGLKPKRKGGGHQSVSLVLTNKEGKEYVMRALRKSATKYLQAVVFKDQYIDDLFDNTATEGLLLDIFTAAHPYAPFTIATLSDAVNVYHTNPILYYIPKQNALKGYNDSYGNALYMIEERATSGHGDLASFGYSNTVISTDDMLKKLRKNHKYTIDQAAYIRARLFDMLIGDWDRHEDQWRWAEFKAKDQYIFFRPIPRDRDQAFSIMGDGALLGIATKAIPTLRLMQSYSENLRKPKWFNLEPYPLDMALINSTDTSIWDKQVLYLQKHLTEKVITKAFKNFPSEVRDASIATIKNQLLSRLKKLQQISDSYYSEIHKNGVIIGTDKEDYFEIIRMPKGKTQIIISTKKKNKAYYTKIFNHQLTKEILIYGLDGEDDFKVFGKGSNLIPIRIIGGQDNDSYTINNGRKIILTDYKSKKNTFKTTKGKKRLTDNYERNVYNYKNVVYKTMQLIPQIGFNKDDGFKIGLKNIYTNNGIHKNHFSQKQTISASYFTATNGFEFLYNGEYNKVFGNFKFNFDATFTSPNYSLNFFGLGNETQNFDTSLGDNYNRVKLKTIRFSPSLVRNGVNGSRIKAAITYEILEAENTPNRYISSISPIKFPSIIFNNQYFIGTDLSYSYKNVDNNAFPTLGLDFALQMGYRNNLNTHKNIGYIIPTFGFDYKLVPNGDLVIATKIKAHLNLNSNFEFYHAASIGANDGLRGYRNQRFTGKDSYYQNIDLRYRFPNMKTAILPINLGIFTGFDYGRVWLNNEHSNIWHTSFGGGLLLSISDFMTTKIGVFNSDEDTLVSFSLHIGF